MCIGSVGKLSRDELPKKGHAEHAMGNDAIQANSMCGLLIQVNRIVVARRIGVAMKLLLRNRRFDKWRKLLANGCIQNTHKYLLLGRDQSGPYDAKKRDA